MLEFSLNSIVPNPVTQSNNVMCSASIHKGLQFQKNDSATVEQYKVITVMGFYMERHRETVLIVIAQTLLAF